MEHTEQDWELFKQKFNLRSGINLNDYKPLQMQRRIINLINRHGVGSYCAFFTLLEQDMGLYNDFVAYITINFTEFFRTPEKFIELEKKVLPELLQDKSRLNIWSAGCSIGAEPYSLAIILNEITPGVKHRILATDLDKEILTKAREGIFSSNEFKNIAQLREKKHFRQTADGYMIEDEIKSRVEFRRHNLLLDRFESGFDLILCRNVVIYFTEQAKERLYQRFFTALKPGGILFVGGTEAILNFRTIGFQSFLPFFYRKPFK